MEKILSNEKRKRKVEIMIVSFAKVNQIDSTALYELKELLEVWKNKRKLTTII